MKSYTIYIPVLSFSPPPYFLVDYGERCYVVPATPGGWLERSLSTLSRPLYGHIVIESVQERIAVMLKLPDEDEPVENM